MMELEPIARIARSGRARVPVLAAALLAFSACGTMDRSLQEQVAREAAALPLKVDDDAAVRAAATQVAESGLPAPRTVALPGEAGLEDYVAIALRDNPAIAKAIRDLQVLGYRVPQVTSLDDPMVNLVPPVGDMLQTAAGELGGSVGVSQKIPFPGKLSAKGRIAEQSVRMALDNLADLRISTVASVQRAYYDYYLADVSIRITEDSQDLMSRMRDVAAARYRAGLVAQQDVLRAEVELYSLTNDRITLEQQRTTARAMLNSLMNRDVEAPLPPPKPFELAKVDWKLTETMNEALASNPKLARLQQQIKRDLAEVKLAHLNYFPDLTVGFNYTFVSASGLSPVRTGEDAWSLPLGLNLPIWWQKLRARVLEGNAQVLASVSEYEQLRNLILFQIENTLVKIDTQYRQAVLFRDLIVPRARQAVEASTSSYQAGGIEFTSLIDNWKKWLEFSLASYRAMAGLEQRFADLQQLVGVRLPRQPANEPTTQPASAAPQPQSQGSTGR